MTESSELWTFGTTPETVVLDWSEAWRASPLSAVIDLSDPDFRYIAEAVRFMRMAGLDMEDSAMLRLAIDAGHRRAAAATDDDLLGYVPERRMASRSGMEPTKDALPVVYYARLGNRMKIGWTSNLPRRMTVIQPEELLATEPGGPDEEAVRHVQFADLHVVGEWFKYQGALVEHVSLLRLRSM